MNTLHPHGVATLAQLRRVAGLLFIFATIAPLQAVGADPEPWPTHRIQDGGQPREFEVAQDEVGVVDKGGEAHIERPATPARTLKELRETAAARRSEKGVRRVDIILYEKGQPHSEATRRWLTPRVRVELRAGADAAAIAASVGAVDVQRPSYAPGMMVLTVDGAPDAALTAAETLRANPQVASAEPLLARQATKHALPNDPFLSYYPANPGYEWHLLNTGQNGGLPGIDANVTGVWDSWRGAGIRIGILDDGLEVTHPDLLVDTVNDFDFNGNDDDPSPAAGNNHGTACAGVAAARGNNGIGVAGAAPDAQIVGFRLIAGPTTDDQFAAAFSLHNDLIQIKSNSWGFVGDIVGGGLYRGPDVLAAAALKDGATNGRGGKGTVYVWAGGNGRGQQSDSNSDGFRNTIHALTVASVDDRGMQTSYGEPGSNILISAPSGSDYHQGITTTDLLGSAGYNSTSTLDYANRDYTDTFSGTSSSCPLVSGVIGLLLQANPSLTARDVKEILVRTARKNDPLDEEWVTNGAGLHFNYKYGAGLVDAGAAVAMATGWSSVAPQVTAVLDQQNINVPIPANSTATRTFSYLPPQDLKLENVTLGVDISYPMRGNLEVLLTSPSGVTSRLLRPRGNDTGTGLKWTMMSTHFWGERAAGTWTVSVRGGGSSGTLNSATLTFFGTTVGAGGNTPVITGFTSATGGVGRAFSYRLTAANSPTSFTATNLPAPLTIDTATGVISGTPTAGGTYTIPVSATNGSGTGTGTITIIVNGVSASLAQALDTPQQISSDGNRVWFLQSTVTKDGIDAAQSGSIDPGGTSTMETTVTGPADVRFFWKMAALGGGYLRCLVDGVKQDELTGDSDWSARLVTVAAGTHVVRWVYGQSATFSGGVGAAWVDQLEVIAGPPVITSAATATGFLGVDFSYFITATNRPTSYAITGTPFQAFTSTGEVRGTASTLGTFNGTITATNRFGTGSAPLTITIVDPSPTLADAIDRSGTTFTLQGNTAWVRETTTTHDGADAAQTGPLAANQFSAMVATVNGPATVSFFWKVSSELGKDILHLQVDGAEYDAISGEVDWQQRLIGLRSGSHTLRWYYAKDGSGSGGADAGWVDQLTTTPVSTAPLVTSAPTVSGNLGTSFSFQLTSSPFAQSFDVQNLPPGLTYNSISGLISGTPTAIGTYKCDVSVSNEFGFQQRALLLITILDPNAPLKDAGDAGALDFSVAGDASWFRESTETHDGIDAVQSGAVAGLQSSTLAATVAGPGNLAFYWRVSSELGHDFLRCLVDGVERASISGETAWAQQSIAIATGAHAVQWVYSKDRTGSAGLDAGWVDEITRPAGTAVPVITSASAAAGGTGAVFSYQITATQLPETFGASGLPAGLTVSATSGLITGKPTVSGTFNVTISGGNSFGVGSAPLTLTVSDVDAALKNATDAPSLSFDSSGQSTWSRQTVTTHDGTDAAQSGAVGAQQTSVMETVVTGPGDLTFYWKVSSQPSYDFLRCTVDGVNNGAISGEVDWQQRTITLTPGAHVVQWSYSRITSTPAGSDAGWVDQVVRPAGAAKPLLTSAALAGGNVNLPFTYRTVASDAPTAFAATGLPAGLTISSRSGVVSGTPTVAGTSVATLQLTNGFGTTSVPVTFQISDAAALKNGFDALTLNFQTPGVGGWFRQTALTHDGVDALQSSSIADGGFAILQTTVSGPTSVSFYWKVSSEYFDALQCYVDTEERGRISEEVDWTAKTIQIPAGIHTVRWIYAKDQSNSQGADTGWLDMITLPPPTDLDGDGYTSDFEAYFGTSDNNAAQAPVPLVTKGAQGVSVQFPSVSGNVYVVERSTDLVTWQATSITASGPVTTYTLPAPVTAPQIFFRVRRP